MSEPCAATGCLQPGRYRAAIDRALYCWDHYEEIGRYDGALDPVGTRCDICGERGELLRATTYGERLVRCRVHMPCATCSRHFGTVSVPTEDGSAWLCARHVRGLRR